MTWTYSGDPATSDRDRIRFELGDVKETPQSLSDGEVAFALTQEPDDIYLAASYCATAMARRYYGVSLTSKMVGDLTLAYNYANTAAQYERLAEDLLRKRGSNASPRGPLMADESPASFQIGMYDSFGWDGIVRKWPE